MLKHLKTYLHKYLGKCDGATAIEYGMIAGLLSILILVGLLVAGPELAAMFNNIGTDLATANS